MLTFSRAVIELLGVGTGSGSDRVNAGTTRIDDDYPVSTAPGSDTFSVVNFMHASAPKARVLPQPSSLFELRLSLRYILRHWQRRECSGLRLSFSSCPGCSFLTNPRVHLPYDPSGRESLASADEPDAP